MKARPVDLLPARARNFPQESSRILRHTGQLKKKCFMEVAKNNFDFDHIQSTVKVKGCGTERQNFHLFVVCGFFCWVFVCFVWLVFVFVLLCLFVCFVFLVFF